MHFPMQWIDFADCHTEISAAEASVRELHDVLPPAHCRYSALSATTPDKVRVVIVGQDPYHGVGEAHGLSFSVMPGVKIPPSLRNIYKELVADIGGAMPSHGCLQSWADQGVCLLNAILSVKKDVPASHRKIGWELVTDRIIAALSDNREGIVFMLWGNFAKAKAPLIDPSRHLVIESSHPSPIGGSCNKGFFGSRPFSRANEYLTKHGKGTIDWQSVQR